MEATGLDGLHSIYQGHIFFQKDTYGFEARKELAKLCGDTGRNWAESEQLSRKTGRKKCGKIWLQTNEQLAEVGKTCKTNSETARSDHAQIRDKSGTNLGGMVRNGASSGWGGGHCPNLKHGLDARTPLSILNCKSLGA